jgi:GntR family transcriptional regulator/MocR family aminotransferase
MIPLKLSGSGPLHLQLSTALRKAILSARLAPGARLLPSRRLAGELGLSRNTVLQAYEQLCAEGYASARSGSGTYVAASLPRASRDATRSGAATPQLSALGERLLHAVPKPLLEQRSPARLPFDFRYGEPAYAELPMTAWARTVGRCARQLRERDLGYPPYAGLPALQEAVAGYVGRSRGVVCTPEQVLITQGTQEAIDLTVRMLVDPGDIAVLEEPHYRGFARALLAAGASLDAVPADAQGMATQALARIPRAKLACVTPSHQFPAGGVLSLERRLALLDWSERSGALVLEDDYDGEFRYGGSPVPSLSSLDERGRVIYVGTASKIFFPALRLGWMVLPEGLVEPFTAAKALGNSVPSTLEQLAFASFVQEGQLERHVQRIRRRFAAKRAALLEAVSEQLGTRARVVGSAAGIHVLLVCDALPASRLPELSERCRREQVGVYPANLYYRQPPEHAELLLGYASLEEREIREGVRRLGSVLSELGV